MANKPIKTYYVGSISCSIWENDFEGRKSYKFTFQRRAVNPKTKEVKYHNDFTPASICELQTLVNYLADKQIKELKPKKPDYAQELPDESYPDFEWYYNNDIENIQF